MTPNPRRYAINGDLVANWAYAEDFCPSGEVGLRARARAGELGCPAPSTGACSLIATLAACLGATSAVEIGTSAGVGLLALLSGMPDKGIVTTVDAEAEHQRAAREALIEAGISTTRARMINSRPDEVLPRLADGAYDIVLLSGNKLDYLARLPEALRLLRTGGALIVDGALASGNVPDPARRDPVTVTVRELNRTLRERDDLVVSLSATGDGVLVAVKR